MIGFDVGLCCEDNQLVARVIASTLAFLLTAVVGSPMTCIGWEGSASARHACCARAHHAHATDQAAADDCCARHEQGRQSEQATQPDPGGIIAVIPAVFPATHGLTPPQDASSLTVAPSPPHPPDLTSPPLRI